MTPHQRLLSRGLGQNWNHQEHIEHTEGSFNSLEHAKSSSTCLTAENVETHTKTLHYIAFIQCFSPREHSNGRGVAK